MYTGRLLKEKTIQFTKLKLNCVKIITIYFSLNVCICEMVFTYDQIALSCTQITLDICKSLFCLWIISYGFVNLLRP